MSNLNEKQRVEARRRVKIMRAERERTLPSFDKAEIFIDGFHGLTSMNENESALQKLNDAIGSGISDLIDSIGTLMDMTWKLYEKTSNHHFPLTTKSHCFPLTNDRDYSPLTEEKILKYRSELFDLYFTIGQIAETRDELFFALVTRTSEILGNVRKMREVYLDLYEESEYDYELSEIINEQFDEKSDEKN